MQQSYKERSFIVIPSIEEVIISGISTQH